MERVVYIMMVVAGSIIIFCSAVLAWIYCEARDAASSDEQKYREERETK